MAHDADMVAIETHHGARIVFCSPYCIWAFGCGNPMEAIDYLPAGLEMACCQWCSGCGRNLSPHLGVTGCMVHGEHCYSIQRWFLRTRAALDFCRMYWFRTGEVLDISNTPAWRRAIQMWSSDEFAGADGLELFQRVMSELA